MTDARLLVYLLVWASTTPSARNEAFNVVNGDVFRSRWMWGQITDWFGIKAASFDDTLKPLEQQMTADAAMWSKIASEHGLCESDLGRLSSPWHKDADLGRPIEVGTDMSNSRELGFTAYQPTDKAFFDLFAELRSGQLIP